MKESFGSQVGSCFGFAFLIASLRACVCVCHCQVFEVTPPPPFLGGSFGTRLLSIGIFQALATSIDLRCFLFCLLFGCVGHWRKGKETEYFVNYHDCSASN